MTWHAAKEGMEERNRKAERGNNSKKREKKGRGRTGKETTKGGEESELEAG